MTIVNYTNETSNDLETHAKKNLSGDGWEGLILYLLVCNGI